MSISSLPEGFNPHKGIKRVFDGRRKAIETGEGVDWGFAEALAFGTLVSEGGHHCKLCLRCSSPCTTSLQVHSGRLAKGMT